MKSDPSALPLLAPISWLALGAFSIGTEGFMIRSGDVDQTRLLHGIEGPRS
ncbi:hypothetical protein [Caballeronia sp. M23-90]